MIFEETIEELNNDEIETIVAEEDDELLPVEEIDVTEDVDVPLAMSKIEAVLFAAGYPVPYRKLGKTLGIAAGMVKSIVLDYVKLYNYSDTVPRGVILIAYDSTCQLCTKESYGETVREVLGIKKGGNLSQSSLETLSIVAYNEPVTKAFIETVRGVDSTYTISNLCEKQLIYVSGKLDVPGRPNLYSTTENFLRVFGLNSLDELPEVEVSTAGTQERIDFNETKGSENSESKEENEE